MQDGSKETAKITCSITGSLRECKPTLTPLRKVTVFKQDTRICTLSHPLACKNNYLRIGISNPWHSRTNKVSTWINSEYHVGRLVCGRELKVTKAEGRYPWKVAASSFHWVQLRLESPYHPSAGLSGNQQELEVLLCQKKGVAISSDLPAYFTSNFRRK